MNMRLRIMFTPLLILVLNQSGIVQSLKCGTTTTLREKRIIGGQNVTHHEFPWQSAIRWRVGITKGEHVCGGSVISKKFVLTAAHCFEHSTNVDHYDVTVGDHSSSVFTNNEQVRRIKEIIIHPGYNSLTYDSDIALIELVNEVVLNDFVNRICLPTFADFEFPDQICTITGWGSTVQNDPSPSVILKKVDVPVVSHGDCNHFKSYAGKVTSNMFCAGYQDGRADACGGDSGGPLQCVSKTTGRWILNGITSWGEGCGAKDKYGVYVVVRHFLAWITEKTGGNQIPPTASPPIPATPPVPKTPPIPATPPTPSVPKTPPIPATPPTPPVPKTPPIHATPPTPPVPKTPPIPATPPVPFVPKTPPIPATPLTPKTPLKPATTPVVTTTSSSNSTSTSIKSSMSRSEFLVLLRQLRKRAIEKLRRRIQQHVEDW